jgi:molecular chaperone GrpE
MTQNDQKEDVISIDNEQNNNINELSTSQDDSIKTLQIEVDSLKDRLLRTAAELENTRRRTDKQIQEAREYSVTSFAKDLVGIIDNLERAMQYKPENLTPEFENVVQGVKMIYSELKNVLTKHDIKALETSIGDKFDYNIHQAISQIQTNQYPKGSIVDIMQIGYKLKDRLLRPAVVVIADGQHETS